MKGCAQRLSGIGWSTKRGAKGGLLRALTASSFRAPIFLPKVDFIFDVDFIFGRTSSISRAEVSLTYQAFHHARRKR
jgi:hypothetical protein